MSNRDSLFFNNSLNTPKFPFDDNTESEFIDDDDDCLICKKLLLDHNKEELNECYKTLVDKQKIKKRLSRKNLEGT